MLTIFNNELFSYENMNIEDINALYIAHRITNAKLTDLTSCTIYALQHVDNDILTILRKKGYHCQLDGHYLKISWQKPKDNLLNHILPNAKEKVDKYYAQKLHVSYYLNYAQNSNLNQFQIVLPEELDPRLLQDLKEKNYIVSYSNLNKVFSYTITLCLANV